MWVELADFNGESHMANLDRAILIKSDGTGGTLIGFEPDTWVRFNTPYTKFKNSIRNKERIRYDNRQLAL